MRRIAGLIGVVAAVVAGLVAAPAGAASAPTRYSLVNGCWSVRAGGQEPAGGPFRLQATTLGQYLLYSPGGTFLADGQGGLPLLSGGGNIGLAANPSTAAEWVVDGSPGSLTMRNRSTGRQLAATFTPATGCAAYPEAEIDAAGSPFHGSSTAGAVKGVVDAHAHITAFEFIGGDFHCGRPWHPYGAPYALPDCASIQGPQGVAAPVQNFLDFGQPAAPHDTVGWPTFKDWPGPDKLTYEGDYYTGLKRAWLGGLRVFVTDLVDNEALCDVMPMKRNPCNDMASVRLQDEDLTELERYIDAQAGGPGKGWFRLVKDPFQARRVIAQGKLAVIKGIEVSRIFGCGENNGVSQCSTADVDKGLDELRRRGITTFFPVHKFDNAFGGTKMDGGELGAIINAANHLETGHFWDVKTCTGNQEDRQQLTTPAFGGLETLFDGPLKGLLPSGTLPTYPAAPHCNDRGLSDLGVYLIRRMAKRHFVLQLDHMDVKTADAALAVAESLHYSGVVSAHSWDSPPESGRIYKLGGFVTPIAGHSPAAFVQEWKNDKALRDPKSRYRFGFGYGSDMNGLAEESAPTSDHPIPYPFASLDGKVTFTREVWGQRTFDLNNDGLANYGMFPDWLQELRQLGGPQVGRDMLGGAESYLEMWERADGIPATRCRATKAFFGDHRLGLLRVGESAERLLRRAGQPSGRGPTSYRFCVKSSKAAIRMALTPSGRIGLIATTGRRHRSGELHPGMKAKALRGHARRVGGGLWLGPRSGKGRLAFRVRKGRVHAMAIVAPSVAGGAKSVRAQLRRAGA